MKRRQYLGVLSIPALLALTGGVSAQTLPEPQGFEPADTWFGPIGDRPEPDWVGFDNAEGTVAYIATDSGEFSTIEVDADGGWDETPTHLVGYNQAELPTGLPTGTAFFDDSRGVPTWWDRDHYEWPNFVDNNDVLTTPQTVSNTTTETQVFSLNVNPGSMVQGRVYQLDLMGTFGTANTSDQFTIIIDLGGTELATLTNEPDNATSDPWSMETTYTVRSHGQNGEVQPHSRGVFNSVTRDDHHPTATIDTTVTETLTVSVSWDAADPENTVTLGQAHLKQMA